MPHISMMTLGVDDLDRATAFHESCGRERSSAPVPGTVSRLHGSTAALGLVDREASAADAGLPAASAPAPRAADDAG